MKYFIIGIVTAMTIDFAYQHIPAKPKPHKCDWEECPMDFTYEPYSDAWCIQQIHKAQPELSYEDAEYILMMDCKDITINEQ